MNYVVVGWSHVVVVYASHVVPSYILGSVDIKGYLVAACLER